jgi:bifunctional DNA-binding transcriptional regulator/antitoxin component of YhaV-PrlF toxin-antitoxin module
VLFGSRQARTWLRSSCFPWIPECAKVIIMAKVNSNLELPIPRAIAERYGIRPGDELEVLPANDSIRVIPVRHDESQERVAARLSRFREMLRQYDETADKRPAFASGQRGWHCEDLYQDRGFPG